MTVVDLKVASMSSERSGGVDNFGSQDFEPQPMKRRWDQVSLGSADQRTDKKEREREIVCVCERERERKKEREIMCV